MGGDEEEEGRWVEMRRKKGGGWRCGGRRKVGGDVEGERRWVEMRREKEGGWR